MFSKSWNIVLMFLYLNRHVYNVWGWNIVILHCLCPVVGHATLLYFIKTSNLFYGAKVNVKH